MLLLNGYLNWDFRFKFAMKHPDLHCFVPNNILVVPCCQSQLRGPAIVSSTSQPYTAAPGISPINIGGLFFNSQTIKRNRRLPNFKQIPGVLPENQVFFFLGDIQCVYKINTIDQPLLTHRVGAAEQ